MGKYSIASSGWRYQLTVAFALMTVIPLLTFAYFLGAYLIPNVITRESILLIVGLDIALSLAGLMLLGHTFRSLLRFREYIKVVATGDLSQPFPVSEGPEFIEIAGSLQRIVRTLRNDRDQLADFAKHLEKEVAQRTAELQAANIRLSDSLARITAMQEALIKREHDAAKDVGAGTRDAAAMQDLRSLVSELRRLHGQPGK